MGKKVSLKFTLTLMLLASAFTCLVLLLTIGRELGVFSGRYRYVREYAVLLSRIETLYIGEHDISETVTAANRAAVASIGDQWSFYLTREEYSSVMERMTNRLPGIGIRVAPDEETGGIDILYVYRGSAAEDAGLVFGDVIIAIDGEDITHLEFEEARSLFPRALGETIDLTVMRGDGSVETLTAVFSIIIVDPVTSYEMLAGNIGYIALSNFDAGSADSFISAVDRLIEQGARAFIFDVRNNNGGRVTELTRILDHLLPEGEIFISVDRRGVEEITRSGPETIDLPAVVLVNRYSFSAAEYFAAMLQEYDYADVVGERTPGKGRSQLLLRLPGGSGLNISTAEYLTKNRVSLYDTDGVTPDYEIDLTEEQFARLRGRTLPQDEDPQLIGALRLLQVY